jgi:hypothetical protein
MTILVNFPPTRTAVIGALAAVGALLGSLGGCVTAGYEVSSGYGGGAEFGYGVDYYEPYGYDYRGWGRGYPVAPPLRSYGYRDREGEHDRGRDRDHDREHGQPQRRPSPRLANPPAYHPAPSGRPMPSIPSQPRGGQSRSGDRGDRGH